jgi:hypothetical protein
MLGETHEEFKAFVRESKELPGDSEQLEAGVYSAGASQANQALQLGLVDSYGYVGQVLKEPSLGSE